MISACGYVCAAVSAVLVWSAVDARAATDPAALFGRKCSACHTVGRGDRVGPDLRGVTKRRSRVWLSSWIRSSQRMIDAGDPTAVALFTTHKRERMPDQALPAEEIAGLIDFLAAGGPASRGVTRPRPAQTATATDIALGRQLFFGAVKPASGGASCGSCHAVRDNGASIGGTFAGDLTHVYSRYQDVALSTFLVRPCSPRAFDGDAAAPLTDTEAFFVKAFLRHVDGGGAQPFHPRGGQR